jgi:hypothetical protein
LIPPRREESRLRDDDDDPQVVALLALSDLIAADLRGLARPVEEHGELELGCWAGEDRRLIAITEF